MNLSAEFNATTGFRYWNLVIDDSLIIGACLPVGKEFGNDSFLLPSYNMNCRRFKGGLHLFSLL